VQLNWLPACGDWDERLRAAKGLDVVEHAREVAGMLRELANFRLDFAQMGKLDRVLQRALAATNESGLPGLEPVRLAILGSATTSHLPPGIRVAGLRRGLAIEVYDAPYGMYWQELMGSEGASPMSPKRDVVRPQLSSGLHAFRPEVVLLALDARHVAGAEGSTAEAALDLMRACWRRAKESFHCTVLQQTVLPAFPDLMGNNEARLPHSSAAVVAKLNELLRPASEQEGVELLALDRFATVEGLDWWYEPGIWHRSKHEVHPRATPGYGDQVARLVAAARGRTAKCLVLDLDNTLWGGVIGDDGLEGIVLGQGSGSGEAFADFQRYAKGLSKRGVILAVCSKNDEKNALEPFERHPEMVLKRGDIACFVANWEDKAANLRHIAKTLNIGLDALVFADDNPVERALIRRELPMVAVPELPDDPALYVQTIAAAGYFEGLRVTEEDRVRGQLYQANAERERLKESVTDMGSYLESLRMTMTAQPFDSVGLSRVTQLINKTNQFNLTTERLTEAEVAERMRDPRRVTLQVRLTDRFGDNGIIAILIARVSDEDATIDEDAIVEIWLMSCRVLGRKVEEACLNVLAERCAALGATRLIGLYRPTEKNGMVREMYRGLGFTLIEEDATGATRWKLDLRGYAQNPVPMNVDCVLEAFA
jgi:FkbH-like protein